MLDFNARRHIESEERAHNEGRAQKREPALRVTWEDIEANPLLRERLKGTPAYQLLLANRFHRP
jgi:hypothetical protein